ncbi:MBL fold metallo-hydrolase [Methanospirillum sp.]|uniref:MBL fold metallo-hydrolase n=1 Tax=Methanospirillum sp. TaxID=45200 RepID=UPI00298529BA|nr:MBL fold metallo-hydrolase [Methanospirillum sp.]
MEIQNLTRDSVIYTSNAWICFGDGKDNAALLIDTGCDPRILDYFHDRKRLTGKNPVGQIILTHNHYDHAHLVEEIKNKYNSTINAFSSYTKGVDRVLRDGDIIRCGRYHFEIISIPGHTSDSICIYCPEEEILFSGDTPVAIWGTGNSYEKAFVLGFEKLAKKKFHTIYPGHGEIINTDTSGLIRRSLSNLYNSRIIE